MFEVSVWYSGQEHASLRQRRHHRKRLGKRRTWRRRLAWRSRRRKRRWLGRRRSTIDADAAAQQHATSCCVCRVFLGRPGGGQIVPAVAQRAKLPWTSRPCYPCCGQYFGQHAQCQHSHCRLEQQHQDFHALDLWRYVWLGHVFPNMICLPTFHVCSGASAATEMCTHTNYKSSSQTLTTRPLLPFSRLRRTCLSWPYTTASVPPPCTKAAG